MSITLRDVTPADDALLRQVYASTRALELEMVPWNDDQKAAFLKSQFEAQDSYYRSQFAAATTGNGTIEHGRFGWDCGWGRTSQEAAHREPCGAVPDVVLPARCRMVSA